jgi:hypothetical protein
MRRCWVTGKVVPEKDRLRTSGMAAVFTVWNKEDSAKPCVGVSADDPEVWSLGGLFDGTWGHGDTWPG